ncbi:tRNA synthetases class I (C) catalytic domain-containing protein [Elsinoe ampelina]|uniref:cysteine--tRNA ligase n=1 Tax=Elsinoe ampelina TaxID=302913 RepID=A0A6A6G5L4_9PEZI|nr:tRNA synthetases class I (C) catalytic domain-containing protein [Elsinoe ampelina]
MAAAMPEWTPPPEPAPEVKERLPKLSIYNSLTRSKKPFVPIDPEGKKVTWYACGPTVYDDAHLGHARNYVSTDIIRRILKDYFKFQVNFVMNITDVDDKIIIAARQQHFLRQYKERHPNIEPDVLDASNQAFQTYLLKNLPLLAQDLTPANFPAALQEKYGHVLAGKSVANDGTPAGDKEAKIKMHIKTATSAAEALVGSTAQPDVFYTKAAGVLLPYLDSQYKTTINSSEHSVFTALTKEYEKRFFEDMGALNVQKPDTLTRVTEYGPQIVDFTKQIQDNGFAYEHEGSVYYDTKAWEKAGGVYARLEPWSKNDKDLQADGEGALSNEKGSFKKSAADFALWKASRPGEPGWESPWGVGRPGWHIECSVMCSDILGKQLDIHSGGIDLAFPHHDNELAQSEAYMCKSNNPGQQWVNYFIHMGHLSIQGAKMSKSLKNFTTVREALAKGDWTPRSLRIAFLLGNWRDGLEITPEVISAGSAWEEKLTNFFLKARDLERNPTTQANDSAATSDETTRQALATAKSKLHNALCDSFDTPTVMRTISDLVTAYNSEKTVSDSVTVEIAKWLTEIINVFGLDSNPDPKQLGWSGIDIADAAKPYIYPLSSLRDEVRQQSIKGEIKDPIAASKVDPSLISSSPDMNGAPFHAVLKSFHDSVQSAISANTPPKSFLQMCDDLRDNTLWQMGIYLEDRENQPALVRPLTASLRADRENREALAKLKITKQAEAKEKAEREAREKLEKGKLDPKEMFKTDEFSAWDEEGMPTKDKEGKEVAKSRSKKLKKEWERQKKLHDEWRKSQGL